MAQVRVYFTDGSKTYTFPCVQSENGSNLSGIKATVIPGTRADGAIVIPGGKKSLEIVIRGIILDNDGYTDISTAMSTMRTNVTTLPATLSLQHFTGGVWVNDWSYTVRRIDEIIFADTLRTCEQPYEAKFLILAY